MRENGQISMSPGDTMISVTVVGYFTDSIRRHETRPGFIRPTVSSSTIESFARGNGQRTRRCGDSPDTSLFFIQVYSSPELGMRLALHSRTRYFPLAREEHLMVCAIARGTFSKTEVSY